MARVLCDPSVSLERVRAVLESSEIGVEMSSPPWSGDDVVGLVSWAPVTAADLDRLGALRRDRNAERRRRPRRRRGGDAARRLGMSRPRLLRRRDGRPRTGASACARARRRRARPERARRCMECSRSGRAAARLRCPTRCHRVRANRSCAREARAVRLAWTSPPTIRSCPTPRSPPREPGRSASTSSYAPRWRYPSMCR